jgi:hypothetical protein
MIEEFLQAVLALKQFNTTIPKECKKYSYIHGLLLTSSLVQSGFNNVLLLAGDTVSKIVEENDTA